MLDRITAYRKRLLAAGYQPLPVNGKKVRLDDWSTSTRPTNSSTLGEHPRPTI